jgi:hypothetical protein
MRLLLAHPGMAGLSCDDCQKYMVAVPVTGAFIFHRITNERLERPTGVRTPCHSCPKCEAFPIAQQNPQHGRQSELSWKNEQTLRLYWRVKGSSGAGLTMDEITRKNFGLIERELFGRDSRERELTNLLLKRGLFKDAP